MTEQLKKVLDTIWPVWARSELTEYVQDLERTIHDQDSQIHELTVLSHSLQQELDKTRETLAIMTTVKNSFSSELEQTKAVQDKFLPAYKQAMDLLRNAKFTSAWLNQVKEFLNHSW